MGMSGVSQSKHGICPAQFRIQRFDDMMKIGFENRQMESRGFVKRMKQAGKKTGLFGRSDGFICSHWKLENNGYPKGFNDYKTYGKHWWTKED